MRRGRRFIKDAVSCQRIVNGTQAMTVYTPITNLAKRAAELAVKLGKGEFVQADSTIDNGFTEVSSVFIDIVPVTAKNMRDTVIADGFHLEKDIYK